MDKYGIELNKIEDEVIGRYLDKSDWDIFDWMNEAEAKRYVFVYKKVNGTCPCCGDAVCAEPCPYVESE